MEAAQILEEADIIFSDNAAKKVSDLIQEEKNNDLKLLYISLVAAVQAFLTASPLTTNIKKATLALKKTAFN